MRWANALGILSIALIALVLNFSRAPNGHKATSTNEVIIETNKENDLLCLEDKLGLNSVANGIERKFVQVADWSAYATMNCSVANTNSKTAVLFVRLKSEKSEGVFRGEIAPNTVTTWKIPIFHLRYASCPHWPSQKGIKMSYEGKKVDTSRISSVQFLREPGQELQVALHGARLATPQKPLKWIDEFGQNSNVIGKEHVRGLSDLKGRDEIESRLLSNLRTAKENAPEELKGTGFFRLEKSNDKWWLVDPTGHFFYSTAIDCVGCGAWTKLNEVSRSAYSWLPKGDGGDFRDALKNGSVSLYRANLIRKWGTAYKTKCSQRAVERMKHWGFNTLGNWTEPALLKEANMPYVSTGPKTWELKIPYLDGDIPDVYHPAFASEAERVARSLSTEKADRNLIGHFIDNELPWWNIPYDVFALDVGAPAKEAWLSLLKRRYATIAALNKAWGTDVKNFESVRWTGKETTPQAVSDMKELLGQFAERFYSTWYRAVKLADPNHLILGSRIPYNIEEVTEACARNTDVLSINLYSQDPANELDRYHELTNKPILIGEYAFDSLDEGLLTAWVPVQRQLDRALGFTYYTEQAAAKRFVVGSHYFQYLDEPLTGRKDGETSFNGFVRVTDVPYQHLVEAARRTNARVHAIHAGVVTPGSQKPH